MHIIRTPIGTFSIDEPAKEMTQAQYDALPEAEKNNGTYYIKDASGKTIAEIIGVTDFSSVGNSISDALVKLNDDTVKSADVVTDAEAQQIIDGVLNSDLNTGSENVGNFSDIILKGVNIDKYIDDRLVSILNQATSSYE